MYAIRKFTEAMMKNAKTIGNAFFRYRKQFIAEHGDPKDLLFIDDEENRTIFVMASFQKRERMRAFISILQDEERSK